MGDTDCELRCLRLGIFSNTTAGEAVCDEFIFMRGEPGDEREQLKRRLCDSIDRHWSDFEHLRDLRKLAGRTRWILGESRSFTEVTLNGFSVFVQAAKKLPHIKRGALSHL